MPKRKFLSFSDLKFSEGKPAKATLNFPNGFGVNIYYRSSATNKELPYELELLRNNVPVIDQRISDDNIGYCSEDDITTLMHQIQRLWNTFLLF